MSSRIQSAYIGIFINILLQTYVVTQTPWKEIDTTLYVVTLYDEGAANYGNAKSICNNIGATLVKLDYVEVKNAVHNNREGSVPDYFWIGAEAQNIASCGNGVNAINCIWKWVDGTSVNISSINWNVGQPDNYENRENRMIIGRDNTIGDVQPSFSAGTICQKRKAPWKEVDATIYVVTIYNVKAENYGDAKSICNNIGATLVQLDYVEVKNAVLNNREGSDFGFFWIGAEAQNIASCDTGSAAIDCIWKWVDGTFVDMSSISWNVGQPDNYGNRENRMIIDRDNMIRDVSPSFLEQAGTICQKRKANQCDPNPCQNMGSCSLTYSDPYYSCHCVGGYYGDACDVSNCDSSPCQNAGTCSPTTTGLNFTCQCGDGYFGTTCDEMYCTHHPNSCNSGVCTSKTTYPFFECNCNGTGYYGDTCNEKYCEYHDVNPCSHGGTCISEPDFDLHYKCNCTGTGYNGYICSQEQITIQSNNEAIGIVGAFANIEVEVTTDDGPLTIDVHKDIMSEPPLQSKVNVTTGTTTFIFNITSTENEGTYIFIAFPASNEYTRNTSTTLVVHVNASVEEISQTFIFSPVTNGSSEVRCKASGIPQPIVGWYRSDGSPIINSTSEPGVYQTFNSTTSILHVYNAVTDDDGVYTCNATNDVGENMTSVFDAKVTQLAVYGRPSIEQVLAKECSPNGTLSIGWTPNEQTTKVLHRFTVESINATMEENFTKFATIDETDLVEFKDLMPWTQYNILIEVCPDECIPNFNASGVNTTGHGLPGRVKNSDVDLDEDLNLCVVEWDIPDTPVDQVTEYTISVIEKYVYEPTQEETTSIGANNLTIPASELSYQHDTKPNMNYTFTVTAKTCAGSGDAATATGKCTTKSSGPSEVPEAVIENIGEASTTRPITIPLADETNGPISCTFVIVNRGNNVNSSRSFGIEELEDAANAAFSGGDGDYIAIAIPREEMEGNKFEANLGENEESQCDISLLFDNKSRNRRNAGVNGTVIKGKNLPLKTDGAVYAVYPVATTPVTGEESLVTIGIFVSFTNGSPSLAWIGGVVGGAVALALIVIAAFYFWRRRNPDTKNVDDQRRESLKHSVALPIVPMQRDTIYENVDYENLKTATDIPFTTLLQRYNILRANESMQFRVQYQDLKTKAKAAAPSTNLGGSEEMMPKNRYKNILPYDSTRVVLEGDGIDGYINACYVTGHDKTFIATQGPLPNTVIDFWRMVAEQNCKVIVMLTKCEEAGRRKCQQYWPEYNQSMYYGDISVKNQDERHFGGYVRRTFHVSWQMNKKLTVNQYHFVKWPDHGVPKTTSAFFRFHKAVMENYRETRQDAPMLVHCSAGVGRTGAFIGYDILQGQTANKTSVDIYNCVLSMRKERIDMVQTCNQYELLHKLMLERYLFGETDVEENEIRTGFEDGKSFPTREQVEKEFALLREAGSLADKRDEDQGAVPALRDRVVIVRQPEDTEWIFIDATYVETYDQQMQLIAAQSPLKSTEEYFLRALLDNNINTIVMLDTPSRGRTSNECVQYWPSILNEPLQLNNLTIILNSQNEHDGVIERKFTVARNDQQQIVTQYQYSNWKRSKLREIKNLISRLQAHVTRIHAATLLVHCSDGLGRSGAFCALINIFERLKQENRVDVFRAVKDLRDLRPGMVQTLEQYKICYEVVKDFLASENIYENSAFESDVEEDPVYENLQT